MFATLFKFDEDQARDKKGRWTTENPGSGMFYDKEKKDWVHPTREVTEEEKIRIRASGMQTVYTDVRLNPDKNSDLIAVGRSAPNEKFPKGKVQYKYSKARSEKNDPEKHARAASYDKDRSKFLAKAEKIMNDKKADPRDRDTAATLLLIDKTLIRNGEVSNKHATGATTLLSREVKVSGDTITLDFTGKHGVHQNHSTTDKALAAYITQRKKGMKPGDRMFATTSERNIKMMRILTANSNYKVHDIRTWGGTATALAEIKKMGIPKDHKEFIRMRNQVAAKVGERLGNDPASALAAYINPMVFKGWAHAEFINPPKKKVRKEEYEQAYLEELMAEFYASLSFDEEVEWEGNDATDFDPDDVEEDDRKVREQSGYGTAKKAGSGVGALFFPMDADILTR